MPDPTNDKERYWHVDPSIFENNTKHSSWARLADMLGSLLREGLFGGLVVYPLALLLIGLFFGGLAFWGSLFVSVAVIGFIISKLGYSRNFDNWNPDHKRQLIGLLAGFIATLAFFVGLAELRLWLLPIMIGALGVGVLVSLRERE